MHKHDNKVRESIITEYEVSMTSPTKLLIVSLFLLTTSILSGSVFAETEFQEQDQLITAGWLEGVLLQPWNIRMRAKLDTGAKTSSLHAVDIRRFKKEGEQWVRFYTGTKSLVKIEMPLVRDVKIKDHKLKAAVRPVVEMTFCLHNQLFTSEFSLIDRSPFNYPILLGRTMLQQGIIVDPSITFTVRSTKKKCETLINSKKEPG